MTRTSAALMLIASFVMAVPAIAQTTDAEKKLAAQVQCNDFKKNPNGSWTSGPTAKIGSVMFNNNTFGVHGFNYHGADLSTVLNEKCSK